MSPTAHSGFGFTTEQFFQSISESEIKRLLASPILQTLGKLYPNDVVGERLQEIAASICDFNGLLREPETRATIISLLPPAKQDELRERVGGLTSPPQTWNSSQVTETSRFFGIDNSLLAVNETPPTRIVSPKYALFPHQRNAVKDVERCLLSTPRKAVLHLPTGAGKTRIAMHIVANMLRRYEPSVTIWLASGKELLEQAEEAFTQAWLHLGNRDIQMGSIWGSRASNVEDFTDGFLAIGLAKAWLGNISSDHDWRLHLAEHTRLVVFDEAHMCIAPTYQEITTDFTFHPECSLLGLTATPGRTWNDIDEDGKLAEFFDRNKISLRVPSDNPIEYLIEEQYLAKPTFVSLETVASYTQQNSSNPLNDENDDIDLDTVTVGHRYIATVIEAINQLLHDGHKKILIFAASVPQARLLAAICSIKSITSAVVSANTPNQERQRIIAQFQTNDGQTMVLVNYGVLTTGFDAPKASAAVIARPTLSLVLYSQMVGRVIRGPKAGGTETCTIISIVDPNIPGFGDVAQAFQNWNDVW